MSLAARFQTALAGLEAPHARLGLAVSGGSDSMALLHLSVPWASATGIHLRVATVNHHLRPGSTSEARDVAQACAALGVPHEILDWTDRSQGNLQDAARQARKALLSDWAQRTKLDAVLTGHTLTDQAETVLMRLARGSGVDGLAGIAPESRDHHTRWVRPLLGIERGELRDWLQAVDVHWQDDPSNDDTRFDRVRARHMAAHLGDLGLTTPRLGALADHMRRARTVLDDAMATLAQKAVTQSAGDVLFDRCALENAAAETRARLLAHGMMWVSGNPYRPRFSALGSIAETLTDATLHGTILRRDGAMLRLSREPKAVANITSGIDDIWDGRWRLVGPSRPGLHIAALGPAGLDLCKKSQETKDLAHILAATPAVWNGDALLAAPLAGAANGWKAQLVPGRDDFHQSLPSH